jgi:hypothetical protein
MSSMRLHATGPVHPDEAWDRYLHPARWSDWSPQIRGVDTDAVRIDPGGLRVSGPFPLVVGYVPLAAAALQRLVRR